MVFTGFFPEFISAVADMLATTEENGAIFMSCLITMILFFLIVVATQGKTKGIAPMGFSVTSVLIFTAMGWFPAWMGGVLAFALSVITVYVISNIARG